MGGPHTLPTQTLGTPPTPLPDAPITAVFLVLFFSGAIIHMRLYRANLARGHKFLFSGATFGFCMARTTACCLRLGWIYHPNNVSLAIASGIFVAAGVLILYIVNLFYVQRIIRARHPQVGWHPVGGVLAIPVIVGITMCSLFMNVTAVVQSYYAVDLNIQRIDRDLQLYGASWFTIVGIMPVFILGAILCIPKRGKIDHFGAGRLRTKIAIVMAASLILTVGAGFRLGAAAVTPVLNSEPLRWFFSKACFYLFDFTVEIIVVYMYALLRVDRRFHVPDGAKGTYKTDEVLDEKSERWDSDDLEARRPSTTINDSKTEFNESMTDINDSASAISRILSINGQSGKYELRSAVDQPKAPPQTPEPEHYELPPGIIARERGEYSL